MNKIQTSGLFKYTKIESADGYHSWILYFKKDNKDYAITIRRIQEMIIRTRFSTSGLSANNGDPLNALKNFVSSALTDKIAIDLNFDFMILRDFITTDSTMENIVPSTELRNIIAKLDGTLTIDFDKTKYKNFLTFDNDKWKILVPVINSRADATYSSLNRLGWNEPVKGYSYKYFSVKNFTNWTIFETTFTLTREGLQNSAMV